MRILFVTLLLALSSFAYGQTPAKDSSSTAAVPMLAMVPLPIQSEEDFTKWASVAKLTQKDTATFRPGFRVRFEEGLTYLLAFVPNKNTKNIRWTVAILKNDRPLVPELWSLPNAAIKRMVANGKRLKL